MHYNNQKVKNHIGRQHNPRFKRFNLTQFWKENLICWNQRQQTRHIGSINIDINVNALRLKCLSCSDPSHKNPLKFGIKKLCSFLVFFHELIWWLKYHLKNNLIYFIFLVVFDLVPKWNLKESSFLRLSNTFPKLTFELSW